MHRQLKLFIDVWYAMKIEPLIFFCSFCDNICLHIKRCIALWYITSANDKVTSDISICMLHDLELFKRVQYDIKVHKNKDMLKYKTMQHSISF